MRIAIVSDVHANADALRAVLDDIDRRNVRAIVCLGDTVGYGAEPSEVLDLLFESCTSSARLKLSFKAQSALKPIEFNVLVCSRCCCS